MLFVWARAVVLNDELKANIIAPSWTQPFRIGPWLRREKDKRYYFSDFCNEGYIDGLKKTFLLSIKNQISESLFNGNLSDNQILVVENGKNGNIYFHPLIGHEALIQKELYRIISSNIRNNIFKKTKDQSFIGVHIRRGDFKLIDQAIPIEWYANTIESLHSILPKRLETRVFSDAHVDELETLTKINNVKIMPRAPAIEDLLVLSESRLMIGTSLSTFSLWASFFNRTPTIWSPKSPGVHGYGLEKFHHIQSDWNGNFDIDEQNQFFNTIVK